MKHPIDELMQDHRVIEQVLVALEAVASSRPLEFYEKVVDFISHFADEHHHRKEEGHLFRALAAHGMPDRGGPIGCMLDEHDDARANVERMREAVAAGDVGAAARAGADYAALLRSHIAKEDNILYEIARDILPEQVFDDLALHFEAVESATPRQTRYRKLAQELLQSVC